MNSHLDVIVVGAGYAGLSASYHLQQSGLSHLVLERGSIAHSWKSQRWNSFRMNTANKHNALPGEIIQASEEDNFESATSLADRMRNFALTHTLPVMEHSEVVSVIKDPLTQLFSVTVSHTEGQKAYECREVIIASGVQTKKRVSPLETKVARDIRQLHSSEYRSAEQLSPGAVLIVGSGQSGCQIAEDIVRTGRKVFLSTSKVARCPRRYRGKDIIDWLNLTGFFDTRREEVADPAMLLMPAPLVKGTDGGDKTLSLQALAAQGVTLLGRMKDAENYSIHCANDVAENMAFGDASSGRIKQLIDGFIAQNALTLPEPERDPEDETQASFEVYEYGSSFDLKAHNVTSIIWANGFRSDFPYIKLPVFDQSGNVMHEQGRSPVAGLYFVGLPWQRLRKSNVLLGMNADAEFIVQQIVAGRLLQNKKAAIAAS
jgi:putative flavoprotein involved in K+ transport